MAFARHRIEGESELNAKKWSRIVISSADDFYGSVLSSTAAAASVIGLGIVVIGKVSNFFSRPVGRGGVYRRTQAGWVRIGRTELSMLHLQLEGIFHYLSLSMNCI